MSLEAIEVAVAVVLGVVAGVGTVAAVVVRALLRGPATNHPSAAPPYQDGDAHVCHPKATAREVHQGTARTLHVCACGRREWWDD